MKAMDRDSTTLQEAVKYVRSAIANHRDQYGSKGSTRATTFAQRQVLVPSREGSPTSDSSPSRVEPKLSKRKGSNRSSLDELMCHLTSMVEKLTTTVQQSIGRQQTPPSSPVARGRLLEKTRSR